MAVRYKTCLLIDDNFIDNFVTRKILETGQFAETILVMQSAQEAIDALRRGVIKPEVIFLDVRMPMMSGFEFLEEFEKLDADVKDVRIFMLSSSLDPTDINKSSNNKYVAQFVHKPLTHDVLEELCA